LSFSDDEILEEFVSQRRIFARDMEWLPAQDYRIFVGKPKGGKPRGSKRWPGMVVDYDDETRTAFARYQLAKHAYKRERGLCLHGSCDVPTAGVHCEYHALHHAAHRHMRKTAKHRLGLCEENGGECLWKKFEAYKEARR
jgi:hypothetical protein